MYRITLLQKCIVKFDMSAFLEKKMDGKIDRSVSNISKIIKVFLK